MPFPPLLKGTVIGLKDTRMNPNSLRVSVGKKQNSLSWPFAVFLKIVTASITSIAVQFYFLKTHLLVQEICLLICGETIHVQRVNYGRG